MKLSGRTLKRRLYSLSLLRERLSRAKYFRGHSVHSPFVYGMVRTVFMHTKQDSTESSDMVERIMNGGLSKKRSIQLYKAALYCESENPSVDSMDGDFCVFTPSYPTSSLETAYAECRKNGKVCVITVPNADRERRSVCLPLFNGHDGTAIDNRAYIIFMNNDLPKQHFRL